MDSLYSKLKKQVSDKISDGLQLIKRSSSATSAQFNDFSWDSGMPPKHSFNFSREFLNNQSQTSLKSPSVSQAQTSDRTLDFGNGPPAIHEGAGAAAGLQ